MCPMRFLLVFFSAILAGYIAWRTVRSAPEALPEDSAAEKVDQQKKFNFTRMMQNGFWGFVDMASGRYLWRNWREIHNKESK